MSSPQLPGYESLEGRIALVDQGAAAGATGVEGVAEGLRPGVEDVALAVVGRRGAGRLVAELRTALDRQRLRQ